MRAIAFSLFFTTADFFERNTLLEYEVRVCTNVPGLYARTLALKKVNPRLKVLLAVGGWRAGSEPFVAVVNSETNRKSFAENAALFIRRHGFDGLDIDWEFPGSRGSGPEHKSLFTLLLKVKHVLNSF